MRRLPTLAASLLILFTTLSIAPAAMGQDLPSSQQRIDLAITGMEGADVLIFSEPHDGNGKNVDLMTIQSRSGFAKDVLTCGSESCSTRDRYPTSERHLVIGRSRDGTFYVTTRSRTTKTPRFHTVEDERLPFLRLAETPYAEARSWIADRFGETPPDPQDKPRDSVHVSVTEQQGSFRSGLTFLLKAEAPRKDGPEGSLEITISGAEGVTAITSLDEDGNEVQYGDFSTNGKVGVWTPFSQTLVGSEEIRLKVTTQDEAEKAQVSFSTSDYPEDRVSVTLPEPLSWEAPGWYDTVSLVFGILGFTVTAVLIIFLFITKPWARSDSARSGNTRYADRIQQPPHKRFLKWIKGVVLNTPNPENVESQGDPSNGSPDNSSGSGDENLKALKNSDDKASRRKYGGTGGEGGTNHAVARHVATEDRGGKKPTETHKNEFDELKKELNEIKEELNELKENFEKNNKKYSEQISDLHAYIDVTVKTLRANEIPIPGSLSGNEVEDDDHEINRGVDKIISNEEQEGRDATPPHPRSTRDIQDLPASHEPTHSSQTDAAPPRRPSDRASDLFLNWCRHENLFNRHPRFKSKIEREMPGARTEVVYWDRGSEGDVFTHERGGGVPFWLVELADEKLIFPAPSTEERFEEFNVAYDGQASPGTIHSITPARLHESGGALVVKTRGKLSE